MKPVNTTNINDCAVPLVFWFLLLPSTTHTHTPVFVVLKTCTKCRLAFLTKRISLKNVCWPTLRKTHFPPHFFKSVLSNVHHNQLKTHPQQAAIHHVVSHFQSANSVLEYSYGEGFYRHNVAFVF